MKIFSTLATVVSTVAMASIVLALVLPAQAAGGAQAAKGKVSMCVGCHGIPQYRTAYPEVYHVPKIAGQSAEYIVKALQAYRDGGRNHPSMVGIARGLTDADIADLAAYYGKADAKNSK
jgi:cytochrome c553